MLAAAVVAAELVLLAVGAASGEFLLAVSLAAAGAYFLVAFRAPTAAAMMIWIATPLSVEMNLPGGAAIAVPTEPMIGITLLAWLTRAAYERRWPLGVSGLYRPLMLLGGVALLSVAAGAFRVAGIKAWLVSGSYVLLGLLAFADWGGSPGRVERWVRLAVASAALLGLYGAVRSIQLGGTAQNAYGCARPFFPEHGTYAAYLCMILPLALLAAVERRGRARWAYGGATVAILLGIAFSFTRAAWLSVAVVFPLLLAVWVSRHGRWKRLAVPGVIVATVITVVLATGAGEQWKRHLFSVADEGNVSNLERVNRWTAAVAMAQAHPWTGVGYGGYPDSYRLYRHKTIVTEQVYYRMGVHNELLRLLAETGILGFVSALWLLGTVARGAWRIGRASGDSVRGLLAIAILAGLGTYAVHGLFNSYLGVDKVTVPFWFGIGALEALRRSSASASPPDATRLATM
jgi:putative inorganic carbon (HCO3(-)) transporter